MTTSKQAELRRLMKLQLEKQQAQEKEQEKAFQPRGILKTSKTTAVNTNSGVSSLLASYNDSDSDSDVDTAPNATKAKSTRVSWPSEEPKLKQTRIIEPAPSEPTHRKRARLEPQTGGLTEERIQAIQAEMGIKSTPATTTNLSVGNTETEDEFQALLDQANNDDDNTSEATATDASNRQQQDSTANEKEDETPSIDTTELEQVSYQARIAQLRLKAAARRNKKPSAASIDTYTPELALGNNEQEEEDQSSKEKEDELNPLEILRRKRLEAKRSREISEESTP